MTDQTPIVECRDLSVSFETRSGEFPVVRDLNMKVMPGEAVGIVGESGCGKSTIAFAIMRYLGRNGVISGGQVLFDGQDISLLSGEDLRQFRGKKIAMVYQEPSSSLNPSMRIKDQLAEVLVSHERSTLKDAYTHAEKMLRDVRIIDPDRVMNAYPHQLSGGQQQRCVIAMALLAKPDVLILDEPTTALDVTVEAGIIELVQDIAARQGMAMIFISHNLGLILETCSRMMVMYAGEVVEEGRVEDVCEHMRHPYTRALLSALPRPQANKQDRPLVPIPGQLPSTHDTREGCQFAPRCEFSELRQCEGTPVPLTFLPDKDRHGVRCARLDDIVWTDQQHAEADETPVRAGKAILSINNLQKHYPVSDIPLSAIFQDGHMRVVRANEDISFSAFEGEAVALVGESGCGKSTLGKILMGFEEATSGDVLFKSESLGNARIERRDPETVRQLQMVFQNPVDALNPSYSVGRQIARVLRKLVGDQDKSSISARVKELLALVKLPSDIAGRKPHQLSGGQKQRIGILRAFAGEPSLVIADEPTSALDVSVQATIVNLLLDIQRKHATTLIYISHDLSVVRYIADRVIVMYLGHVVEQGPVERVFAPPYHPYTEALLSAVPVADMSYEKRRIVLGGDMPSAINPPSGCPFQTRCPRKIGDICEREMPAEKILSDGHSMRCHLDQETLDDMRPVFQSA